MNSCAQLRVLGVDAIEFLFGGKDGMVPFGRNNANEAKWLVVRGAELMPGVRFDIHQVAFVYLTCLKTHQSRAAAAMDDDLMGVLMVLERAPAPGRDLEVPNLNALATVRVEENASGDGAERVAAVCFLVDELVHIVPSSWRSLRPEGTQRFDRMLRGVVRIVLLDGLLRRALGALAHTFILLVS